MKNDEIIEQMGKWVDKIKVIIENNRQESIINERNKKIEEILKK